MISRSAEETRAAGRELAGRIRPGDVVLLSGPLGSGKTTFVQGMAEGLGAEVPATSPSFVIVNEYRLGDGKLGTSSPRSLTPSVLRHVDLYRLPDPAVDADRIGLQELVNDPAVITVIEWAERLPVGLLPKRRRFRVRLAHGEAAGTRHLGVSAAGYAAVALLLLLGALAVAGLLVVLGQRMPGSALAPSERAASSGVPPATEPDRAPPVFQVIATGLEVPWALAFAPDGALYSAEPESHDREAVVKGGPDAVSAEPTLLGAKRPDAPDVRPGTLYATERPGRLVRIRDGKTETITTLPDVSQRSESGLLGLALDPRFSENQALYLYFTTQRGTNRVVRYRLADAGLADERILLDNIPAAAFHDGGRIAFGPDGNLYITTGDAAQPELAQRLGSLAGKILRIRPDGTIPADNPFPSSPVYSLGHRNPQGLAWAADGALYSTEHGPSGPGALCCHDEVNRIEPGKNYGWPQVVGSGGKSGFVDPVIESGPTETWAPAGSAIIGDTLFFGGLRGEALYALDFKNPSNPRVLFKGEFGRIRDVVRGPDGALYVATSNRDGRGKPTSDDDRIIRVDPSAL